MNLKENFFKYFYFKNKIIYLIILLPISLFIGSSINNLFILIIIFTYLFQLQKKKKFEFNLLFNLIIILYLYLILNSIFLTQTNEGIIRAIGFIRFPLLAFAIAYYLRVEDESYLKPVLKTWFIIFIIVSIDIIFEFFFGFNSIGNVSNYAGRLASFSGDELKIGGYYFGFVLLALWIVNKDYKNYFYLYLIFFLICSLLIGEKANFLKSLFITSIFLIIIYNQSIIKKISFLTLFLVLAFIFIKSTPSFNSRFIAHTFNNISTLDYENIVKSNEHFSHYHTAYEIFRENKLFGIGIKNFRNLSYDDKFNPFENINGGSTHPHQIHFEFLSELGLIGYILLFGILIIFISRGIKQYLYNNDILSLVGSIFIIATILPIIPSGSFFTTYTATIFWINVSLILRYKK